MLFSGLIRTHMNDNIDDYFTDTREFVWSFKCQWRNQGSTYPIARQPDTSKTTSWASGFEQSFPLYSI